MGSSSCGDLLRGYNWTGNSMPMLGQSLWSRSWSLQWSVGFCVVQSVSQADKQPA